VEPASANLLAIVGLILVNEAGLPVPVPGDLINIGAGIAAARRPRSGHDPRPARAGEHRLIGEPLLAIVSGVLGPVAVVGIILAVVGGLG
jgi:hypothetical protein